MSYTKAEWEAMDYKQQHKAIERAMKKPVLLFGSRSQYDANWLMFTPVYIHPGDGRIRSYDAYCPVHKEFEGLFITALIRRPSDNDMPDTYAWAVEYRELFAVNLQQAERMVKTLRLIDRRMAKIGEKFGVVESFGQFVAIAAMAMRIETFMHRDTRAVGGIVDAQYWIDNAVRKVIGD